MAVLSFQTNQEVLRFSSLNEPLEPKGIKDQNVNGWNPVVGSRKMDHKTPGPLRLTQHDQETCPGTMLATDPPSAVRLSPTLLQVL